MQSSTTWYTLLGGIAVAHQVAVQGWFHTGSSPRYSHNEFSQTGCPELPSRSASHPPSESSRCRHSSAPSPPTVRKSGLIVRILYHISANMSNIGSFFLGQSGVS